MCGSAPALAEVAEQIAWLGAALRCPPSPGGPGPALRYCRPVVERQEEAQIGTIDHKWNIRFKTRPHAANDASSSNNQCWVGLFRSPVVVEGYPTLSRPEDAKGIGLGIPLHVAAQLVQARRVTTFGGQVFVKGFCAMLVLRKVLQDSKTSTFIWHLMTKEDGAYISYHDCNLSGPIPYDVGADESLLNRLIVHGCHIIGWCQEAHILAGEYASGVYVLRPSFADVSRCDCA